MRTRKLRVIGVAVAIGLAASSAYASSHMDAPLITLDDPANTTDVYAFVSERDGRKYLTTALAVYPFEEPGIGPNAYQFDDNVRYQIHISTGENLAKGRPTYSYQFDFETEFANSQTILQSYLGVINDVNDAAQNRRQSYRVTRINRTVGKKHPAYRNVLGMGDVPPNNQGIATPFYNQNDDGTQPAREGVSSAAALDRYTQQTIALLGHDHRAFAGQRDDGFYADIQAIFDLLQLRSGDDRFDSQGGFNVHMIAVEIPIDEIGGDLQQVGVYATTSRRTVTVRTRKKGEKSFGRYAQVGRQGNPLFCEALVAIEDKDLYNRTSPEKDVALFEKYAETPELAALINALVFDSSVAPETDRSDIVAIFIPDLIRVDLSTAAARLAGNGPDDPNNPDDVGFHRLGIFSLFLDDPPAVPDVLISQIQEGFGGGTLPGGWPNGRRFGDDVIDIAVTAVISDLRDPANLVVLVADGIDNVSANDIGYNKVFPYAATPLNGRNHGHH